MRNKLIAYSMVVCLLSFGVSVYLQTLTYVADDLKTMSHHAEVAVETLETYQKQSEKLGNWLDSFYEIQCRLASRMIRNRKSVPDRQIMKLYADYLNAKYLFLFDKNGNVIVTNSNYDHIKVGSKTDEPFYDFRVLLEGADSVILPPVKNAIKYVCVLIFIYYGLSQFGAKTQTLLASAGILSLMVSLGAKDMVSDILAGFFIIFESTYKVGDYIKVGSWEGIVTEIGIRTTKVKFVTDVKVFNNSSLRDIVCSEEVTRQSVKIGISYDADLEIIEDILKAELSEIGPDKIPGLRKGPMYTGISSFGESSIVLQITMLVDNTTRFPALRALNREIKLIFDRHHIEIPFNQLVIHEAAEQHTEKTEESPKINEAE